MAVEGDGEENESRPKQDVSRARILFSQVVACVCLDFLLVDLGLSISFVTVVLPEVLNAKEGVSINEYQASWFGSMAFLCQPLGSIFSGPILDYFGRRKALFLVNIPHLIAWLLLYYSWNIPSLFVANALLGIGTGIMEAPSITYIGEVSETSIRGILTTLTNGFTLTGMFAAYFLGTVLPWRQAALLCLSVPLTTMLMVLLVPETPIWLLSKGRKRDALKSLCRLRGWVRPESVRDEFEELINYNEIINQCPVCVRNNQNICEHFNKNALQRFKIKIKYVLLSKDTIRPFSLVMAYFLFHTMSGLGPVKPNMINLCKALGMKYDSKTIVVIVGALYIITSILSAVSVKLLGKRKLVVTSMLATSLCTIALSVYSKSLDPKVFSYETDTFPEQSSMTAVILFLLLVFFTTLGIPWVLLSEVFPFRSRGIATGLAAAGSYVIMFLATKTNYDLERNFGLSGTFACYSAFGLVGSVYMYFMLPETENKTLIEVEEYYRGKCRIFADDCFVNRFKRKTVEASDPMLGVI